MEQDKSVQQMQATGARLMSTPGLPAAMVSRARSQPQLNGRSDERDTIIMDLQRQLQGEKDRNRCMEDQFKYRVASFVKRETTTKNKIDSLERRLNEGTDHDEHQQRMGVIHNMHGGVISSIHSIQSNTNVILQSQEKDLMRAFRGRLGEVTRDLEAHRSKKGAGCTELQAKLRRVVAELREAQELAQTFDKKNQELQKENGKLQDTLHTEGDDRGELLKELVVVKKENAKLKTQVKGGVLGSRGAPSGEELLRDADHAASSSRPPRHMDASKLLQTKNHQYEREVQYRQEAAKLKRLMEGERLQVRALQQEQADMQRQRRELEELLEHCLQDVTSEIERHNEAAQPASRPVSPDDANVHDLSAQDRERVLELLFSQQRVVELLYTKTFPTEFSSGPSEEAAAESKPPADDFGWLGDIVPPAGS